MSHHIDRENMFNAIWKFPENIEDALMIGENINLQNKYIDIQNIIIAGMGGSAIGGDVVSTLEKNCIKIPIKVVRGYSCPNWVNQNTLVICSSYSGNTEETLSILDDALERKAQICGITAGGELSDRLKNLEKDFILIPAGLQPRAALAYSFIPIIKILQKCGVISPSLDQWIQSSISQLKKVRELYSKDQKNNPVFQLALKIKNRIPVIYADSSSMGIAGLRLKGQLAENSKILSWNNELPELNHNEIVGWENNADLLQRMFVIWLIDKSDHKRVQCRQKISKMILDEIYIDQISILVSGNSFQSRFLHMIHYGDWLSYWCAILYRTNPSPVHKIARLKHELKIYK